MDQDEEEWQEATKPKRRRSKRTKREHKSSPLPEETSTEDLSLIHASTFLESAQSLPEQPIDNEHPGFETVAIPILDELKQARRRVEARVVLRNEHGHLVRPLSQVEGDQLLEDLVQKYQSIGTTTPENILLRRLGHGGVLERNLVPPTQQNHVAVPLAAPAEDQPVPTEVIDGLYAIKSTPYENSFASRLYGFQPSTSKVFFQDWETISPWMELTADIIDHHRLSSPENHEDQLYNWAPITYTPIYAHHLPQVHDLVERTFWPGIDVSDSVNWEPEQCSIIASYKKLVVGCAFLSESMDPYVTYIAVRAGWDRSGIATFMLYHLIKTNPDHDITLHVSATNPAMLLYNRFGFKAEEFVVGFYDDYLDNQSKLCKNALRLRYRR